MPSIGRQESVEKLAQAVEKARPSLLKVFYKELFPQQLVPQQLTAIEVAGFVRVFWFTVNWRIGSGELVTGAEWDLSLAV